MTWWKLLTAGHKRLGLFSVSAGCELDGLSWGGACRGQLRPTLLHSEATPSAGQKRPHTALILHHGTDASLFSEEPSQRDGAAPSHIFVLKPISEVGSEATEDGPEMTNILITALEENTGLGTFVWLLICWYQFCGCFCFLLFIWFMHRKATYRAIKMSNCCHWHNNLCCW